VHATPGTPPKERAQREQTTQTTVGKIKILEHECINICDKGTCMWKEMKNTPELQALEEKIMVAQEQVNQATERANTLPPIERMTTLLANKKLYLAVEQLKEEQ
jgi:hypothetical protein